MTRNIITAFSFVFAGALSHSYAMDGGLKEQEIEAEFERAANATVDAAQAGEPLFPSLGHLDFRSRNLKVCPVKIWRMKDLSVLDLPYNALETLSDDISQLSGLESLNLARNPLKQLPEGLSRCINLRELYLSDNAELSSLPIWLVRMSSLITFGLNNLQQLTQLPVGIEKLPLKFLDLTNTPIKTLPMSLKNRQSQGQLRLIGFTGTFIEQISSQTTEESTNTN